MKRLLVLSAMCLLGAAAHAAPPRDSLYQLPITLTDQAGHAEAWGARRGQVQVVSMFYTSCTMVCPMIIQTMQATRHALPEGQREKLHLFAVSFDPAHDDVAALDRYATVHHLDRHAWTLARAEPAQVRQLSALLGLQYREQPGGMFNHSSQLILLDAEGRELARTSVIGRTDPAFVAAVTRATAP